MADINQSSWSPTDASNDSASPAGFPEGMSPSGVNDAMRAVMGAIRRWRDDLCPTVTSGGSANVQTLTYTVAHTGYATGDIFAFIAGFTNTGDTTLNVDGLGAKQVVASIALTGGEITAGKVTRVYYNGTVFVLLGIDQPAVTAVLPLTPAGTTSVSAVMMGLGATATITPRVTGKIMFWITGDAYLDAGPLSLQMAPHLGSGAAPAHGDAAGGGAVGRTITATSSTAGASSPFCLVGYAEEAIGVTYWIDLALTSGGSGSTAVVANISVRAMELSQ